MGDVQYVKDGVQLLFAAHGKKLVDLTDVALLRRIAPLHIEHQSFQQIQFGVVPEVVSPLAAGILDDDITEKLGHQFLALDLGEAVPGIGGGGGNQVEYLHGVPLIPEVGAALFVEFTLGITDYQRGLAGGTLQDHIHAKGPGLFGAAGPVHG